MAAGAPLSSPDLSDTPTPTLPPIQGTASPAAAASPSQPLSPGAGAPGIGAAPQGGIAQGAAGTKGQIATPDVKPEYDPKKLAKAQTTLDLLNAMKPASRTDYMAWWEKQHGAIDDKYDNLKTQLGARPSDDEPQSKKEKFAALLEFGLHLMKNSSQPTTNQGAVLTGTLSDEMDASQSKHQATIAAKQGAYDTQAGAIESGREEEQKGIGTPAQAMKAQSDLDKNRAGELKDTSTAFKNISGATDAKASALGPSTYAVGPGGVIHSLTRDADGKAHAEPVTGIDGKPFQGKVLGRSAGSGVDKAGQDPAAVRTYKYATAVVGMDPESAKSILGVKPSGNPNADHASVYKSVVQATMGDEEKAKRVADQYVIDSYGAGALARANSPSVPTPGAPPPQALSQLKPGSGQYLDFGAKGKWTLGIDGKPVRVGASPLTGP